MTGELSLRERLRFLARAIAATTDVLDGAFAGAFGAGVFVLAVEWIVFGWTVPTTAGDVLGVLAAVLKIGVALLVFAVVALVPRFLAGRLLKDRFGPSRSRTDGLGVTEGLDEP